MAAQAAPVARPAVRRRRQQACQVSRRLAHQRQLRQALAGRPGRRGLCRIVRRQSVNQVVGLPLGRRANVEARLHVRRVALRGARARIP